MNKSLLVITVICAALAGCTGYHRGGNPEKIANEVTKLRESGAEVRITGDCDSSCVLKLNAGPGLCISPTASFGVHEVRRTTTGDYQNGVRDDLGTLMMKIRLPVCAYRLFESKNAFASGDLTIFSGEEILEACPEIKSCKGRFSDIFR